MKFGYDFHIESKFNYKGFDCYVGLLFLGHRCGYVEFNKNELNKSVDELFDLIDGKIGNEITYSNHSEKEDYWIFGFDYGHIHNTHDLVALKEYFPEEYKKHGEDLKQLDENNSIYKTLGTQELAEETCKLLCTCLEEYKIN